ncbi:hypothetical protein NC653_032072 [Populus alba x Populus x berolinensis]|uniref:Uncharacterized protein n=1 Tax=Populus alba x Populus x berolinensis TaxID=444605 RepID=A0AAD6LR06_9ROSI|nr:hypothetical protein NC653_032072 [Populus alba x Populus x berolinensis]
MVLFVLVIGTKIFVFQSDQKHLPASLQPCPSGCCDQKSSYFFGFSFLSSNFQVCVMVKQKPELGWFKPSIPVHSFDMAVYFLLAIRDD